MINHELRSTGLGGSDIAAIVGMDKRRDAFDVYNEKLGLVSPIVPTQRMKCGKALEQVIAMIYAAETGLPVQWFDTTIKGPHAHQVLTPDGFILQPDKASYIIPGDIDLAEYSQGGLDAKNVAWDQAHLWGDSESDVIPDSIGIQFNWYMSGTNLPWWDASTLFGGNDWRRFRVNRDTKLESVLLEEGDNFWRKHIEPRIPPPMGSTDRTKAYLRERFPKNVSVLRKADVDEEELCIRYQRIKAEFDAAEKTKKSLENSIKECIGEADGLTFTGGRVTWKEMKKEGYWVGPQAYRKWDYRLSAGGIKTRRR